MVGQLEGELELHERRLTVGGIHVRDDVGRRVEDDAIRTVGDLRAGFVIGVPVLLVRLGLRRVCGHRAVVAEEQEGRSSAADEHQRAGGRDDEDEPERKLLLTALFAFTLGAFAVDFLLGAPVGYVLGHGVPKRWRSRWR